MKQFALFSTFSCLVAFASAAPSPTVSPTPQTARREASKLPSPTSTPTVRVSPTSSPSATPAVSASHTGSSGDLSSSVFTPPLGQGAKKEEEVPKAGGKFKSQAKKFFPNQFELMTPSPTPKPAKTGTPTPTPVD